MRTSASLAKVVSLASGTLRAELDGTDRHGWTQLTDLRLLDITAWTYGRSAATPSPGGRR